MYNPKNSNRFYGHHLRCMFCFFWVVNAIRNEKSCLQFLIPIAVFYMLLRGGSTRLKITWVKQRQHHRAQESARERMVSLLLRRQFFSHFRLLTFLFFIYSTPKVVHMWWEAAKLCDQCLPCLLDTFLTKSPTANMWRHCRSMFSHALNRLKLLGNRRCLRFCFFLSSGVKYNKNVAKRCILIW